MLSQEIKDQLDEIYRKQELGIPLELDEISFVLERISEYLRYIVGSVQRSVRSKSTGYPEFDQDEEIAQT